MDDNWILDPDTGEHRKARDATEWDEFRKSLKQRTDWIVGKDTVNGQSVSTVFLGWYFEDREGGQPWLWETLLPDGETIRHPNREEAAIMHRAIVEVLKQEMAAV